MQGRIKLLHTIEGALSHRFHPVGVVSICQNVMFDPPRQSQHAFLFCFVTMVNVLDQYLLGF